MYQVGFSLTEVKVSHICLALTQIAEGAGLEFHMVIFAVSLFKRIE